MSNFLEKSSFIDRFFAQRALARFGGSPTAEPLLVVLFALFRLGHLALDTSPGGLARASAALGVETLDLPDLGAESPCMVRYGDLIYLQKNATCIAEIARHLKRLSSTPPMRPLLPEEIDPSLNPEQAAAVELATQESLCVLSGGPGTGKTFTAVQIVKACLRRQSAEKPLQVVLSAPTGKAACHLRAHVEKQMALNPLVHIKSGTLHSILQWSGREEDKTPPLFADLVIVDESSMIDAPLFERFLGALQEGTRLVLIGDPHQLPAVGAGSIFADLVEFPVCKGVQLNSCVRSDKQGILRLAEAVRNGDAERALEALSSSDAVEWVDITSESPAAFLAALWQRFGSHFIHHFPAPVEPEFLLSLMGDFSILSCLRKGPMGVDAVNAYFLTQVMARAQGASWVALPLMMTVSQRDLDLYNGQQGILMCRPTSSPLSGRFSVEDYVVFEGARTFPAALLSGFSLSYCFSVHKSQGSEYREVLVLAPEGSDVFGREILYTAITRAKQRVMLAVAKPLLRSCIALSSRRYSGLGVFEKLFRSSAH
jgi:exodeoxyribonuclease V alpha subunit